MKHGHFKNRLDEFYKPKRNYINLQEKCPRCSYEPEDKLWYGHIFKDNWFDKMLQAARWPF